MKEYDTQLFPCIICNSTTFENIANKDKHNLPISCGICKKCGLIQLNPRMNKESYTNFYKSLYNQIYHDNILPDDLFQYYLYKKGEKIYNLLNQMFGEIQRKTILEIGCSSGGILQFFKEKNNIILGVDLNPSFIQFGNKKGLNIITGTIDNVHTKFDIIIYSHVLEHLSDPVQELIKVRHLLRERGIVYIEVPGLRTQNNYDQFIKKAIQLPHIFYFSSETLNNCMNKAGFEAIYLNDKICSIWKKGKIKRHKNYYQSTLTILQELKNKRPKQFQELCQYYLFLRRACRKNRFISQIYYYILRWIKKGG